MMAVTVTVVVAVIMVMVMVVIMVVPAGFAVTDQKRIHRLGQRVQLRRELSGQKPAQAREDHCLGRQLIQRGSLARRFDIRKRERERAGKDLLHVRCATGKYRRSALLVRREASARDLDEAIEDLSFQRDFRLDLAAHRVAPFLARETLPSHYAAHGAVKPSLWKGLQP